MDDHVREGRHSPRAPDALAPPDPAGLSALTQTLRMLFPQALRGRPDFRIDRVRLADGRECAVEECACTTLPFCTLLHFRKAVRRQPRVLIVAPMSGHYASQLRDTVLTMLPEHDVYLTDWHDARQVPLAAGAFSLAQYVDYLLGFIERIGPGAHVLAICQACVPALCAAALLAEDAHPLRPASLTLMGGPIDARINATVVDSYANSAPLDWFQQHLISTVRSHAPGAGRRVYAAELQLLNSLGMHCQRSADAMRQLWKHPFGLLQASLDAWRMLADEQFALQDLAAEFYLDNLELVFRRHLLPRGLLHCGERLVRPACLSDTALLTVEAEFDDVCGAGQTAAAQRLCSSLPPSLRRHHLQRGATHKGLFTGALWTQQVYPQLRDLIRRAGNA